MARCKVARSFELERRRDVPATVACQRTTAGKDAACNALLQTWHGARYLDEPCRLVVEGGAEPGQCAEEALGVGVPRAAEQLADRCFLHFATGIHHQHW